MTDTQKYIVVFKESVTKDQIKKYVEDVNKNGGEVTQEYDPATINGFAAKIPDQYLQQFQSFHNDVIEFIERDGVVTTQS